MLRVFRRRQTMSARRWLKELAKRLRRAGHNADFRLTWLPIMTAVGGEKFELFVRAEPHNEEAVSLIYLDNRGLAEQEQGSWRKPNHIERYALTETALHEAVTQIDAFFRGSISSP